MLNLDDIVASHDISDENIQHLEAGILVEKVSSEVRETIDAIMKEDDSRELYTLDTAKTDPIKMPVFEGRDDEDFEHFKEKVIKSFAQNRICKDGKVAKLREVLRGHAKKLIPESRITDIDEAWAALDIAFGDPTRLLRSKMEKLLKLGMLPKENAKGGLKAQVEW